MNKKLIITLVATTLSTPAWSEGVKLDLSPVVITATRVEQNSFDLPVSINAITADEIQEGQQKVHLSESAARIPGIVVNNRNHAAQELSINSRGFGPRAQFGVRGIRLYQDGIPLTMPDGQGQTGTFNLDNAARVEFMRGPFSAMYGNSSGGVVQSFTKKGGPDTELSVEAFIGEYGTHRETLTASGQQGNVDYVLNDAHYSTDGYRTFSKFKRDTLNAKIGIDLSEATRVTLIATDLDQPNVQDPGGLTMAQFLANPKQSNSSNQSTNAHKEISHTHAGVLVEHRISETDTVNAMAYYGYRSNYQSLSTNAISGYKRHFGGVNVGWLHNGSLLDRPLNFTAGVNYDSMSDDRYRYTGGVNGFVVAGSVLSRKELNEAYNVDEYVQAQWDMHEKLAAHAGVRHTDITYNLIDYKAHAYDGSRNFTQTLPVVGLIYKVTPEFNLYGNASKGFETPTFAEQEYNSVPNPTAPNNNLQASRSDNYEVGAKAFIGDNIMMNIALFKVYTEKEIVVDATSNGISSYKNAGDTERDGLELSADGNFSNNIRTYLAYTHINAEFSQAFGSVKAGNKIPGVYKDRTYAEVSWKHPETGFFTALEGLYSSRAFANDVNTAASPSYTVFNWRGGFKQSLNNWHLTEYLRWDNVGDKSYVSSIKVNDSNSNFYEPGLPSNVTLGVSVNYSFK